MKANPILFTIALLVAAAGCKKEEAPAEPPVEEVMPEAEAPVAEAPPEPEPEPMMDEDADYVRIKATHSEPKPTDPVVVVFQDVDVKSAAFDPANLEGGSANIVVNLASLKTDSEKRDKHLQSPDYLDVPSFATADIAISKVKKTGDNRYSAQAVVDVHGKKQTWPVEFEVIDTTDQSVRIKAQHTFKRSDFGIGKPAGASGEPDPVADEMIAELQLSLQPTS